MPNIINPAGITNSRQLAGGAINTCAKRKNITSINLICNESKNVQVLELGKQTLVIFKTAGRDFVITDELVTVEVIPSGAFTLTSIRWSAQPKWILESLITANREGEATLQFKVEGCPVNTIKLTTKVNSGKDVFDKSAIDRLVSENEVSLSKKTACIIATDRQFGKLFSNTTFFMTGSKSNGADVETVYKRAEQIKCGGFVKSEKIFPADVIAWQGIKKPEGYNEKYKHAISEYLESEINNRQGFHVFYFTILDGYHVLTLVVNALDPCNKTYKVYDQLRRRGEMDFKGIDDDFLQLTSRNWSESTKFKTVFGFWKMKIK